MLKIVFLCSTFIIFVNSMPVDEIECGDAYIQVNSTYCLPKSNVPETTTFDQDRCKTDGELVICKPDYDYEFDTPCDKICENYYEIINGQEVVKERCRSVCRQVVRVVPRCGDLEVLDARGNCVSTSRAVSSNESIDYEALFQEQSNEDSTLICDCECCECNSDCFGAPLAPPAFCGDSEIMDARGNCVPKLNGTPLEESVDYEALFQEQSIKDDRPRPPQQGSHVGSFLRGMLASLLQG